MIETFPPPALTIGHDDPRSAGPAAIVIAITLAIGVRLAVGRTGRVRVRGMIWRLDLPWPQRDHSRGHPAGRCYHAADEECRSALGAASSG